MPPTIGCDSVRFVPHTTMSRSSVEEAHYLSKERLPLRAVCEYVTKLGGYDTRCALSMGRANTERPSFRAELTAIFKGINWWKDNGQVMTSEFTLPR